MLKEILYSIFHKIHSLCKPYKLNFEWYLFTVIKSSNKPLKYFLRNQSDHNRAVYHCYHPSNNLEKILFKTILTIVLHQ